MTLMWNMVIKYLLRVTLTGVRNHTDSLASFAFSIVVLLANPIQQIYQTF